MRDIIEQTPSERDEQIYAMWESGKTLRTLAREMGTSVTEVELAIDRCLPVFNSATQMRAYKREIQKLEDAGTKYHARTMQGDINSGHLYARINERYCAMQGWSSVNIRLDPYQAQTQQQPKRFDRLYEQIMAFKQRESPSNGNGNALPPPSEPSSDDRNRSDSTLTRDAT
jgi:hypothetical protein